MVLAAFEPAIQTHTSDCAATGIDILRRYFYYYYLFLSVLSYLSS